MKGIKTEGNEQVLREIHDKVYHYHGGMTMDIHINGIGDVPELDKITYDQLTASGIQIHNCGLRMYHDDMIYLLRVGKPGYGLYFWQYAEEYDDFCDWRMTMFNSKWNKDQSHRDSYVWFNMDSFGVCGVPPEEVKQLIIRWNRSHFWRYGVDFWQWFSAMIGENVHCFSVLWNDGNPSMIGLPMIKSNG